MQLISANAGVLQFQRVQDGVAVAGITFSSISPALAPIDNLLPHGGLARGAVHEILTDPRTPPWFFAMLLARSAAEDSPQNGAVVWSDPQGELYPPAMAAMDFPLEKLFLLRVADPADRLWAIAQCMRCKAVAATVATPETLSRIETRRLQLAAEHGGGIGVLLRRADATASIYAAATRWLVRPIPGSRSVQRWNVQLVHGHGGLINKPVILEVCRDTNDIHHVRAVDSLADHADQTEIAKASA